SIGSRLPAYATSMGRVLLGGLAPQELDAYLARTKFTAYTKRTITDPKALKKAVLTDEKKGWSLVDQELEDGLRSISVPIVDGRGRILAAMNISGQAARTSEAQIVKTFLPRLKAAAERISAALRMRRG
ncbi:MAG: IclR family transcriptional regulator, partial [Proteobacteria bacterium]|nr:IclR family transcriptional regulator [Pseudomonadota bacterium]